MFIWFCAMSVLVVWAVFQSPAIDYRTVMLGSIIPLAGVPFGLGPLNSLMAPVVVLGVVMASTIGRRLVRRRWLGIPIGMFLNLVFDGAWSNPSIFWWPIGGLSFPDESAFVISRGIWSFLLELLGVMCALWLFGRLGLDDPARRSHFVRTGQVGREFVRRDPEVGTDS